MFSTHLRRDHIHGLMIGVAAGEALGLALQGLSRRQILKKVGHAPIRYCLLPGIGLTGRHTSHLILAAQSTVCSASESRNLVETYQKRLRLFIFSLPIGLDAASLKAGLKSWFRLFKVQTGSNSLGNSGATRAIFCALALHGTGSRWRRWVEQITCITHTNPLTIDGCQVLAGLADMTVTQLETFDPLDICRKLPTLSNRPEIRELLDQLPAFLEKGRSPWSVAKHFGWNAGVPSQIVPTTVMASYCFLRHSKSYRKAVESAIRLGGDASGMGAIVGGLSGAYLGISEIPKGLIDKLSDVAYGPTWMKGMAVRMSHWPHGPDDLHSAHAEPTAVVELTAMNMLRAVLLAINRSQRIPSYLGIGNNP